MNKITLSSVALLSLFFLSCSSQEKPDQPKSSHENHTQSDTAENIKDTMVEKQTENPLSDASTTVPTDIAVISHQEAILPKEIEFTYSMQADGYVLPDVRRNRIVASRFAGRIEKSYVKSNYQYIRAGQVLFEVYSPEVNSLIEEYLFLKRKNASEPLLQSQKDKLLLLGLSDTYLENVLKNKKLLPVKIHSNFSGYVLLNDGAAVPAGGTSAQSAATGGGMSSMAGATSSQSSSPIAGTGRIREGEYFSKGQTLLQINDLKSVWAMTSFTMTHGNFLKKGMAVVVSPRLDSNYKTPSKLDFIEPIHQSGQKFFQVRSYVPNPNTKYRPYAQIIGRITHSVSGLGVPRSAVYDTGRKQIVWVKKGQSGNSSIFYAREVVIAPSEKDSIVVISGITFQDTLARDAAYLVDREGLIKIEKRK